MRRCCDSIWNNLEINGGYTIRVRKGCSFKGEEGGGTPNERGIFFRLQVYERVGISLVGRKICHLGLLKGPKGLVQMNFMASESRENFLFLPTIPI